jgi:hypothetical protein
MWKNLAGSTLVALLLGNSPSAAQYIICRGDGEGSSCRGRGVISYSCNDFDASFGQATEDIADKLGAKFCVMENAGEQTQMPYDVIPQPSASGGSCGWSVWIVNCQRKL